MDLPSIPDANSEEPAPSTSAFDSSTTEPSSSNTTGDSKSAADSKKLKTYGQGLDPAYFNVSLQVQQLDPDSPLSSAATWEETGISPPLLNAVRTIQFRKPSRIQGTAIPLALKNPPEHLIAQAQSGTGKTAAFVLSLLSRIDESKNCTQGLVMCNSRELARQIKDVVEQLGQYYTKLTQRLLVPGFESETLITDHLIISTPGILLKHISKKLVDLSTVRCWVLDEADVMIGNPKFSNLGSQTERIKKSLNSKNCQILLFSATFDPQTLSFIKKLIPRANLIKVAKAKLSHKALQEYFIPVKGASKKFEKVIELYDILTTGQSMIFVETRSDARKLATYLRERNYTVALLTGGEMSPAERDRVIDEFKNNRTKVLITTNVLSRGIDCLTVNLVLNFDLPAKRDGSPDFETYLHRIGRTGRFGRKGYAISFVSDKASYAVIQALAKHFGKPIKRISDLEEFEEELNSAKTT